MAFPKSDRQYALITDAATGTADTPGGLGAILPQLDQEGNFHTISFASRQLNYSPFLLEAAAAVWGMDFFNEYLKGKDSSYTRVTSHYRNLVTCKVKR
jgi:RNase H-like domain found in reverse transcriptase